MENALEVLVGSKSVEAPRFRMLIMEIPAEAPPVFHNCPLWLEPARVRSLIQRTTYCWYKLFGCSALTQCCASFEFSWRLYPTPERLRRGPERKKFRPHSQGEIAVNISETRMALVRCCLALLFAYFLVSPSVWPQANQGAIEGIVVDQSGAVLAGAKLTGTNDATGIHFQTTTDSNGLFTFPVLPVGTYTIEVEHPGFAKLTQKNLTLSVGARLNLNLSLSVAAQTLSD